jgi:hypothetical protein
MKTISFTLDLCSCCPSDFRCASSNVTILCYRIHEKSSKISNIEEDCETANYNLLKLDTYDKVYLFENSTGEIVLPSWKSGLE